MNFGFNNKPVPAFGAASAAVTATSATPASTATGFTFGAATQPAAFSFTPPTANPTTTSIFGASPAAPNFSFGAPQTTQSNMFGGLASLPATTQSTVGFGFPTQPAQSATSFSGFGSPNAAPAAPAAAAPALAFGAKPAGAWPSFGAASPPTAASLNFGQAVTTAAPATGLNTNFTFGSGGNLQQPTATSPITSLNFGQTATSSAVSVASPGFGFGQQTSAAPVVLQPTVAKPALSFGTPNTSAIAANINLVPASTAPLSFGNTGATPSNMFAFGNTNIANTVAVATNVATPAVPSFGLGTSNVSAASMFSKPATTAPVAPIATAAPTSGFSFGTPPQQPAPASQAPGFSFGGATSSPPAFGPPPTSTPASSAAQISVIKSTPSVSFPTTTPQTKPAEFSFGSSAAPATTASNVSLPTSGLSGFQFSPQTGPVSGLGTVSTIVNTSTSNIQPKTLTSGLTIGAVSTAATIPSTSSLPTLPTSFAASTAASSLSGFQLPNTSTITTTTPTVTTLVTTTVSSTVSTQPTPVTSMNFSQLEDAINKWSLELEEQEKVFINQATQVNAWDKLLIANGEKIVALNETLQSVRTEQQSLDHELDFVLGQQRELEELLIPLERELSNVIITDPEREQTYRLADTIDTQLKQMSEDLKEIIEHLNESNRREDNNDPIVQIGRILNAHMSSMQWIDSSIAQISVKLDQLSNMHNMLKRHNKRSFNLTYK